MAELEKLIAADLTHPSIAAPIAAGISGTSAYFAQDFVAADSLDIVVRDHGPAPASDALRVATQLGAALDFAAAVDVLHGSLHPRDVLVSSDDTRVIGLGVAKALEQVGVTPAIRRPYTAPERASNGQWDRRADVFALGAVIYEMLAGKRLATTAEQAGDALVSMPGVDAAGLKILFAKALAEDPAKRFASALEFADALKSALTASSVVLTSAPDTREPVANSPRPVASSPKRAASSLTPMADVALPFELPRPTDTFDIDEVDLKHEPVDLPLHGDSEPVIQLREEIEPPALEPVVHRPQPEVGVGKLEPAALEVPTHSPEPEVGSVTPEPRGRRPEARSAKPEARRPRPDVLSLRPERPEASLRTLEPEGRNHEPSSPKHEPEIGERRRIAPPTAFIDQSTDEFRQSALEKTRSAIWPLALAVGIGLVVGFAGGYGVAMRDRLLPSMSDTPVASAPAAQSPAAAVTSSSTPAPSAPVAAAPPAAVAPPDVSEPPAKTDGAPKTDSAPLVTASAAIPKVAAPATGRLIIRSTPVGARVSVDGKDAGTTPATVRELSIGPHTIRVAEEGYTLGERRIVLTDDRASQAMRFELVKKAAPGASPPPPAGPGGLMIESRPSGASVYMDGRLIGTTPMQIESVAAGDHTIGLAADGYQRWVGAVRVATGERARVTASLER